jgi:hypothetical protein
MSSGSMGITYQVFRPRWWQPWLWITWLRLVRSGRAWGYVDVTTPGGIMRVRVIAQQASGRRP